jgi:hypothetical protein
MDERTLALWFVITIMPMIYDSRKFGVLAPMKLTGWERDLVMQMLPTR